MATHFVQAGASVPAVQEFLGHAKLDTTQGYVLVEREALSRAVEVLDFDASIHMGCGAISSEHDAKVTVHVHSS